MIDRPPGSGSRGPVKGTGGRTPRPKAEVKEQFTLRLLPADWKALDSLRHAHSHIGRSEMVTKLIRAGKGQYFDS